MHRARRLQCAEYQYPSWRVVPRHLRVQDCMCVCLLLLEEAGRQYNHSERERGYLHTLCMRYVIQSTWQGVQHDIHAVLMLCFDCVHH